MSAALLERSVAALGGTGCLRAVQGRGLSAPLGHLVVYASDSFLLPCGAHRLMPEADAVLPPAPSTAELREIRDELRRISRTMEALRGDLA